VLCFSVPPFIHLPVCPFPFLSLQPEAESLLSAECAWYEGIEGETSMSLAENESQRESQNVLLDRRFLTCPECGWVHYVMTPEEKAINDRFLVRYQLTEKERFLYESAYRQCLRCESPADDFRAAEDADLERAAGHIVTPVYVDAEVGTQ
jgi:rRNA maturation protein Nop10